MVTVKPQSSTVHRKNKISRGGGGKLSLIIRVDTNIFNFYPALYSTFLLKFLSTILKDYLHSHLTAYPCHHSKSRNK